MRRRRKAATASVIVAYEPTADTSEAEALIAAALVQLRGVPFVRVAHDGGLISMAVSGLETALETLQVRRTWSTR